MNKYRIAHVTATFPPYRGGTGNVCYHNARELARRGHDVHVFTPLCPGVAAYELCDGVHIHRLRPLVRVGNAALVVELLRALRGFDLIHLHYPFFGGELTSLAARLYRIPLVLTYHQDVLLGGALGLVAHVLGQTAGRLTLRSAARVLFTSLDYAAASHVRPLLRGRDGRIDALSNGVDPEVFYPAEAPAELRARFRPLASDRIVLLVAGLDKAHFFKGVQVFLNALASSPSNIKGVIVGDGDLKSSYAAYADKLGIADRVFFAGRVFDQELPHYYRLADVTMLPSVTMGEAFGMVLIESLACGTPVIASALPGVRTVVQHGADGLLVAPNDPQALAEALQQILADEDLRRAMGRRGRARVDACYDWRRLGVQLEWVYRQVLAERTVETATSAERRLPPQI